MNARTFGNGDAQARVEARYADVDFAQMHADHQAARTESPKSSTPAPAKLATVTPIRIASAGAVDYLLDLSRQLYPAVSADAIRIWAAKVDRTLVSEKIDQFKAERKALNSGTGTKTHQVPEGRYAVTGERGQTVFVKVTLGKHAPFEGRVFVNIQAGDELHRVSPAVRDALLAKIESDGPEAACVRYGQEIGDCGRCGRTLTDEASRAAGIGPVCAGKAW